MPDKPLAAYEFRSLEGYSFKDRITIRLAGWLFYILISGISRTLRYEVVGSEYIEPDIRGYDQPIFCIWHDRIFAGMYFLRRQGIVVMSSISFDAEYTARCIQRLGFGVIKGSSTRGGTRALVEMIRMMKSGVPMAFTIDGPRGPRYVAKPGPPMLAKRTGNPIVPMSVELADSWKLRSWDRFQIPKPFTRARVVFSPPIFVPSDADDSELEAKRQEMQDALDALVADGGAWRSGNGHAG